MAGLASIVCGQSPAPGIASAFVTPAAGTAPPAAFGILGWGWIPLTFAALMVSLLILALLYIFSNFLRNQQLSTWTKFELFQVIGTAALFAFTGILVTGMCTFDMSFLDPVHWHGMNMYDIVDSYFAQLQQIGGLIFVYLMWIIKMINLLAKITWLSNPLGLGMQDSPLESLGQINSIFFFVVGGFFTSLLMVILQMKILNYLAYAVMYYLFPFGVFFRAFEPTRKFGGTLMGLSLSLFLFYPVILVINAYIMNAPLNGNPANGQPGLVADVASMAGGAENNVQNMPGPSSADNIVNEHPDPNAIDQNTGLSTGETIAAGVANGATSLLKPVMFYVVAAVVLPVINFIVLVEITRSMTHIMGEEIDVSNLTRMI